MAVAGESTRKSLDETSEHALAPGILVRIADGVALVDAAWRFTYVNPRGAQVFGRSKAELLGSVIWEVSPALERSTFGRAFRKAMAEEVEVTVEDQAPFAAWFEARALPTGGRLLLLFRDITAQRRIDAQRDDLLHRERRARTEAEEASRIKDEFLATLSHELRTPLNAIVGWAHLLQTAELGPDEQERAVETILRNARMQTRLIEDLLDISRIITGKLRLRMERVQVSHLLETALYSVRPMADAKGISLRLAAGSVAADVMGDAHRLQQVIWNLLANAIKFTLAGGHVTLRTERAGSNVMIEIRDTGQGIHSDFLPHLFERFQQADSTLTRTHGGLGLGLAIVRHLVELHGGSVRAASEGEGKGATFTLILPAIGSDLGLANDTPGESRVEGDKGDENDGTDAVTAGALVGATVIVVDDEPDARELLFSLLTQQGARVLVASTAAEAFGILRREQADVLVCDLGMPDQDGFSFLRKLRASGEAAGGWVPAIALSGYASEKDRCEALFAGFQDHLGKPVEPPRILASIVKLWRRGGRDGAR